MRGSRRILALLISAAVAAGFAGCGGDDDDDSSEALTLDAFLEQGNAVCAEMNDTLDTAAEAAFGDLTEEPSGEQIAAYVNDTLVPAVEETVSDLRDLTPPADIESDVDAMLDSVESSVAELEQQVEDDPTALFTAEEDPFADANQRADDLGLTDCGSGGEGDDTAE